MYVKPEILSAKIEDIVPEDKEIVKYIREQRCIFDIKCNTRLANAFRRTILSEYETPAFEVDIRDISTDDDYIILQALQCAIELIPISQTMEDKKYKIDVRNSTPEYREISSLDIDPKIGVYYRLASLAPGKYLKVNNIKIVRGIGLDHTKFTKTFDVRFRCLDYVDVNILTHKLRISSRMVNKDQLDKLLAKQKLSYIRRSTLIIPNSSLLKRCSEEFIKKIEKVYKVIYEADDDKLDEVLPEQQSTCTAASMYRIRFYTVQSDCRDIIMRVCDSLIDRLTAILGDLTTEEANRKIIVISKEINCTKFEFKKTSSTIIELLKYTSYGLDPVSVTLVKGGPKHPLSRDSVMYLGHADAVGLLTKTTKTILDDVKNIKKAFEKML